MNMGSRHTPTEKIENWADSQFYWASSDEWPSADVVHYHDLCEQIKKAQELESTLIREHQLMKEALQKIDSGHHESWSKGIASDTLKQITL